MPSEDTKMLRFNKYRKSDNVPFVIHADLECLMKKTDGCKKNPERTSMTKVSGHFLSDFSMSTTSPVKDTENKYDVCRRKECVKRFCESLREHTVKIIDFKKKKTKLLTNEKKDLYENAKICFTCKEKFEDKYAKDKKCHKVRYHWHHTSEYRGY